MAESLADHLQVNAGRKRNAGARMAKVMESSALRKSSAAKCSLEEPYDVALINRSADGRRQHQVTVYPRLTEAEPFLVLADSVRPKGAMASAGSITVRRLFLVFTSPISARPFAPRSMARRIAAATNERHDLLAVSLGLSGPVGIARRKFRDALAWRRSRARSRWGTARTGASSNPDRARPSRLTLYLRSRHSRQEFQVRSPPHL